MESRDQSSRNKSETLPDAEGQSLAWDQWGLQFSRALPLGALGGNKPPEVTFAHHTNAYLKHTTIRQLGKLWKSLAGGVLLSRWRFPSDSQRV